MDPSTPLQPYVPPAGANPLPPAMPLPPATPLPSMPAAVPSFAQAPLNSYTPALPANPTNNFAAPSVPAAAAASNDTKTELVEHLRKANNVLVTVSSNPSIDQLAAAIGITLILNKLDKHATAVYSGESPSTLEFLQPDKTIEKNTDSLRDFIIALDKAKADKLRYKVEDKFVKIFITPYHTSLSENDLEFSQGDFNVDVVLALGVHKREELDQAITAHGRILHDAVTVSINNHQTSDLGALNWFNADASSLCEMLVSLVEPLQGDKVLLDDQIATAFLTGVVAETERFSNNKTTPFTMNISATLMKAGANQQLVSSKLQEPLKIPKVEDKKLDEIASDQSAAPTPTATKDGSLAIEHKKEEHKDSSKTLQELEKENKDNEGEIDSDLAKIHIDNDGKLLPADKVITEQAPPAASSMVMQPPSLGGDLSAATKEDRSEPTQNAVDTPATDVGQSQYAKTLKPLSDEEKNQTLADLERAVDSSHVSQSQESAATDTPITAEQARQAIEAANAAVEPSRLEPIDALNAQPISLQADTPASTAETPTSAPAIDSVEDSSAEPQDTDGDGDLTNEEVFPPQVVGPDKGLPPDPTAGAADPSAPPPVPPPLMPPS